MSRNQLAGNPALRILIVRVGAMGDVLHGMPAVAALRQALPGAHIGWAVEPRWAPLLVAAHSSGRSAAMPLVDAIHLVEAKAWSKRPLSLATLHSMHALRRSLRAGSYDLAIDLQGSIRSAVVARASGARYIVGSASPRERPARLLYTAAIPARAEHVVDQGVEIASAAVRLPLFAAQVPLPVDSAAEAWCNALLGGDARLLVFLAPTAGWGAKAWPAQHYGELARQLSREGYRVLVNAAPSSPDPVARNVVEGSGGAALAVPCTLPQLIALLRRVRLVVAGDTGPLHLAAALGVPVVGIFGPTSPARNGPYATRAITLRNANSQTDHRRHAAVEHGLQQITTAEVLAAARQLLQADRTMPHG